MDFFEHQERARRNTLLLVAYFIAAVIAVVISVYLTAVGIIAIAQSQEGGQLERGLWQADLFVAVAGSTLLIILAGSLYKVWSIGGSGEHVAVALGGRQVPSNTRDLSERILLNVVEEMALASGTPVPPVYLMDAEEGINAFAAGTTPQNAVIGVTRGAIETLRRDELQGVIAHEFSHILNGDMRLNIRLMGWLHGILVIAMIGYVMLRTMSYSSMSSSRSSNNDKKNEGGLAIAILVAAIALIIIGYVGVFFAQLIKAAVSRQREYLADSSAAQFTRNPSGLADALKKIGGWKAHAQIRAPQAEESSHMFFGSALTSTLFATHPPLPDRIQRLEPQFSGAFPETQAVRHTAAEIIDTRSLSMRVSGLTAAHTAAVVGAERMASHPGELVESVGEPKEKHIDHVHGLVEQLEAPLAEEVRDPLGALAVIYALLLAPDGTAVRQRQLSELKQNAEARVIAELARVIAAVDRLAVEQRLPVACLSLPSLHQMSPRQANDFQNVVRSLVRIDNQVTLFEFAVQRFIAKRLAGRLQDDGRETKPPKPTKTELQAAHSVVLSTLAQVSGSVNAAAAFGAGLEAFEKSSRSPSVTIPLLPAAECDVQKLDRALDHLELASPALKKHMLASFTACIAFDGHMSVQEGELLRVISDALGCPMPPIV